MLQVSPTLPTSALPRPLSPRGPMQLDPAATCSAWKQKALPTPDPARLRRFGQSEARASCGLSGHHRQSHLLLRNRTLGACEVTMAAWRRV